MANVCKLLLGNSSAKEKNTGFTFFLSRKEVLYVIYFNRGKSHTHTHTHVNDDYLHLKWASVYQKHYLKI